MNFRVAPSLCRGHATAVSLATALVAGMVAWAVPVAPAAARDVIHDASPCLRHRPARLRGESTLDLEGPIDRRIGDRDPGQRTQHASKLSVRTRAGGAEEQFQIDDPTSGDSPGEKQRLDDRPHLGSRLSPGERTRVREVDRHPSAPGGAHDIVVLQLEDPGAEEHLDEGLPVVKADDLAQRRVHRVRERRGCRARL